MKRIAARARRALLRTGASVTGALALLTVFTPPSSAGGSRCSGYTCLTVEGSGRYVAKAHVTPSPGSSFFGHFHLTGGGLNGDSALQHWHEGSRYTMGLGRMVAPRTRICAEAFEHINEKVQPRGRTCVEIQG
ncbi:hypothetical protein [Streptomyces sp. NPDC046261]|uniref:hypothetical protein n=1 Tax=Streptomyces sp. NPDC046261 TaxID=3157200 RepID=UPI0033C6EDCF